MQVQRDILRLLRRRRNGADVPTLARAVVGTDTPTRSELESVRRALRNLQRQGLINATRTRTIYRVV